MRRWVVVCLLALGVIIAYIDRTNLSIALASPDFKTFFNLTDTQRGLVSSAFFWSYTALQIPAGFVVDRYGVRAPLAIGLLLWCVVSAATAASDALWHLVALRLLLGVGESMLFPAGLLWIRRHVEEQQRGLATGIFVSGSKWGPAIAAQAGAWLIVHYGWRSMFLVMGLVGSVWVIPWLLLSRENTLPQQQTAQGGGRQPDVPLVDLLRTRAMWATLIGTFSYNYFLFFALTWLPAYFVERRHLSLDSMGVYTFFSFAGTAVVAILAGFAADVLIRRGGNAVNVRRWFAVAGLALASTEIIGALSDSTNVAVFFAIFSMTGLGLATANYWALTQTLMPGMAAGRIAGLQNTSLNLAGIVAPIITGWLVQTTHSYIAPMQTILAILLIGILSYVFLVRPEVAVSAHPR
jgi:ACS family D-galactonate transporter-like MFS transporter